MKEAITEKTRMVTVQRATGYGWRKAITIEQIQEWADFVHGINPDIICMVDNCYGEFLDVKEPTEVGTDVLAGSLIKNPGGGLALTGGYIAGRQDLIDDIPWNRRRMRIDVRTDTNNVPRAVPGAQNSKWSS